MAKTQDDIQSDIGQISKWAFSWEARAKLIAVILFIFGVVSLTTAFYSILAYLVAFVGSLFMGLSFIFLLKRYLIILPFLLLMTVPLIFGNGLSIEAENVSFATIIFFKAIACMTVMSVLLHTQSIDDFMNSLAQLRVPPIIITILLLSYRYVFLFFDDIQKMLLAAKSRFFSGKINFRNLKIYGQLTGGLLLRSLDRAENVYHAMTARCFSGTVRYQKSQKITLADLCKTFVSTLIIAILILFDRLQN